MGNYRYECRKDRTVCGCKPPSRGQKRWMPCEACAVKAQAQRVALMQQLAARGSVR